ncbi:MAG: glycosyltransferase [Bacteroidia bacterium]|nr:glycosyltransferase [Bacteroidia bacterium]
MTKNLNVLILCAHRPKRSPSQRYRFEQYLPFLEQQGFKFTFSYLLNEKDDHTFYSQGNFPAKVIILLKSVFIRLKDCLRFKNYAIVFIQREASFLGTSFAEKRAFKSGARVIFDFDDSIWLADTSPGNKKWEWIKKPEKFFTNIANAHCVMAGNAYLAEKALPFNKHTIIVPTTVDTALHRPLTGFKKENVVTIGWSGSISTVKHFELLLPVLFKLKKRYGHKIAFKLIGEKNYKHPELEVEAVAWSEATEVQQLNSLDIGIMPLPNDAWANGKCGLKGLTYMACGVAAVMSEVGVNKQIIKHGRNGFLAENDYEWYNVLCELIENKSLREQIGKSGCATVLNNYSVEAFKNTYLQIFSDARKSQ